MQFLIDENVAGNYPGNPSEILNKAGYETLTVYDEDINGSSDLSIMRHCIRENQCLITLDKDFGDRRVYKPEKTPGIVLLCLGLETTPERVTGAIKRLLPIIKDRSPGGKLWILTLENFMECPQGISKRKLRKLVRKILQKERDKKEEPVEPPKRMGYKELVLDRKTRKVA